MRKKKSRTRTVGYGYVGRWMDGTLGWAMPEHLDSYGRRHTNKPDRKVKRYMRDEPVYLCKITVQVVKDKRGREIIRRK